MPWGEEFTPTEPEYTAVLGSIDEGTQGVTLTFFIANPNGGTHVPDTCAPLIAQIGDEFSIHRTRKRVVTYKEL